MWIYSNKTVISIKKSVAQIIGQALITQSHDYRRKKFIWTSVSITCVTLRSVTKKSVRRQKRSPRTNFGSQNWSALAKFGPP